MQNKYGIEPGQIVNLFSLEETSVIEKDWMQIFCKNKQGVNIKTYKWHIFSGDRYPVLEGSEAVAEYRMQVGSEFIVLPNDEDQAVLTDCLPTSCCLSDYYVFPPNMAWVMAFTHEEGWLGPYFARHPNYTELNNDNFKRLKKMRQKAEAKKKGWM